jgi:glutathione synthase/RimK-type ligase-like ATP-grasp enzyme
MPRKVPLRLGFPPVKVALVTCARLGRIDPDDEPLAAALAGRGAAVEAPVWNDPAIDWSAFDLVCTRATWDYHLDREGFLRWLERVAAESRLVHAPGVVRWNSHKRYLADLERRGIPVTPTRFVDAGTTVDLRQLLAEEGWTDAVLKPAVGLDSFGVMRVEPASLDAAQAHLGTTLAGRDAMVQPYLASVADHGERCVVMLDGHLSHAVRKNSAFKGGRHVGPEGRSVPIADDERAVAERVLEAVRP